MKIRPIKRLASLALGAALCLAQAGCSFSGLDAPNLMSPPRASLDQQGIYELLQGDQQELTLVYPKRGDHRSAILMHDWSGDGVEDAVGFVALDRGVEVRFLEKGQDRWRAAASFGNTATQVDLVCFGDLNGDGADDVIIGWGSAAGTTGRTASVSAYLYQEGNVTEYSLGTYGELALTDFDENGVYEVFTVDMYIAAEEEGTGDLPATAHVYAWQEDTLREVHTASADNSVTSYVSIQFGKLGRDLYGVVVDGAKADGSMTTQVFTLFPPTSTRRGTSPNTPWALTASWPSQTLMKTAFTKYLPWICTLPPKRRAPGTFPLRPTCTPGRRTPSGKSTPPAPTTRSPAMFPSSSANWAGIFTG